MRNASDASALPAARLGQRLLLLFVPALPPGLELGLTSLSPFALRLLVVLRPALAKLGELLAAGLLVGAEPGRYPLGLLRSHFLQTLAADRLGFRLDAFVLRLPLLAALPHRPFPALLRFTLGPLELDLEALPPSVRGLQRTLVRLPLGPSELDIPPLAA